MAAVLARTATEFTPFRHDVYTFPFVVQAAYLPSHLESLPSAHIQMHECSVSSYHSSIDSKGTSQPVSSCPESRSLAIGSSQSPPSPDPTPASPSTSPSVSTRGMIIVLDYTPSEGEANIPVTVTLELRLDAWGDGGAFASNMSLNSMKLRLVFGRTAVRTLVSRLSPTSQPDGNGETVPRDAMQLRLYANAPSYSEVRFPGYRVPLTIQAMDETTRVLESLTFGFFTYWTPTTVTPTATIDTNRLPVLPDSIVSKRKREDADEEGRLHLLGTDFPPEIEGREKVLSSITFPSTDKGFKLVRTTNAAAEAFDSAEIQPAILEWVADGQSQHPNSLDKKWSAQELVIGRRLIRFGRGQSGNKLLVSCEIIPQEAYDENDIVISCVYRQETRNCWFTSVDVIYLLERLVGGPFSVEEKNRIRRNLEGLKPTTVSKTKGGFEMFFQRIMDFPAPKPRNIEKDVKVFPWTVLALAIEKIIAKYSVICRIVSDSSSSQEESSLSSNGQAGRAAKAARSRTSSSKSRTTGEVTEATNSTKAAPSHQSVQVAMESPLMVHSEPMFIPEPDATSIPVDNYYYPHAQDLTFPDADQWRRRDSLVSLATSDYYPDQDSHGSPAISSPLNVQAFSNPFASDVNFGVLPFNGHVHGNGFHGPTDINSMPAHNLRFDTNFADDIFESRRSSLSSDLLYPPPEPSSHDNHETVVAPYGGGPPVLHNDPHDFLYAPQFTGSPHQRLQHEDVKP